MKAKKQFKKKVYYDWDEYYHTFAAFIISGLLIGLGLVFYMDGNYFESVTFFVGFLGFNLFAFLFNLILIRKVYWEEI